MRHATAVPPPSTHPPPLPPARRRAHAAPDGARPLQGPDMPPDVPDRPHLREAERVRWEILRRMTPAERWQAAERLYWSARRLKEAFFRQRHPEWSEDEVQAAVREVFLYART
ncbi:MAG: hypothetical protein ACPGUV_01545 [Polyangiales bacterium]